MSGSRAVTKDSNVGQLERGRFLRVSLWPTMKEMSTPAAWEALEFGMASETVGFLREADVDVPSVAGLGGDLGGGLGGEVEGDARESFRVSRTVDFVHSSKTEIMFRAEHVGEPLVHPGREEASGAVGDGKGHSLKPLVVPGGVPELSQSSGTPEQVLLKSTWRTDRNMFGLRGRARPWCHEDKGVLHMRANRHTRPARCCTPPCSAQCTLKGAEDHLGKNP